MPRRVSEPTRASSTQLHADGVDGGGVLEGEVAPDQRPRRRPRTRPRPRRRAPGRRTRHRWRTRPGPGRGRPSAVGSVRAGAGSQNSSSRARWTRRALGGRRRRGSGSRSMLEKRNASAQSLNDATLDGDSEVGRGRAIDAKATDGVGQRGGWSPAENRHPPTRPPPPSPGPSSGPKWPRSGNVDESRRVGQGVDLGLGHGRGSMAMLRSPQATVTGHADLAQAGETVVGQALAVDGGLDERRALEAHAFLVGARTRSRRRPAAPWGRGTPAGVWRRSCRRRPGGTGTGRDA